MIINDVTEMSAFIKIYTHRAYHILCPASENSFAVSKSMAILIIKFYYEFSLSSEKRR